MARFSVMMLLGSVWSVGASQPEGTMMLQIADVNVHAVKGTAEMLVSMHERISAFAVAGVPSDALPFLGTVRDALASVFAEVGNEKTQHKTVHDNLYKAFEDVALAYNASMLLASTSHQSAVTQAKDDHMQCRMSEAADYQETVLCAAERVAAENQFNAASLAAASDDVCDDDDVWSTGPVDDLRGYEDALDTAIQSRIAFDAKVRECERLGREHAAMKATCDAKQTQFEQTACILAVGVQDAVDLYERQYSQAVTAFESEFSTWEEQSVDREHQCQLVATLICYVQALEAHDDKTSLQAAFQLCDENRGDHECANVTFTHQATPNALTMDAIPSAPCQGEFDYGTFPESTTKGTCEVCRGITTPCSNPCSGHGNATGLLVEDNCGCDCDYGYDGEDCGNEIPCSLPCSGHGRSTGTLASNNCACTCDYGYEGEDCGNEIACSESCSGHGQRTGTLVADNCACTCDHGYSGAACGTEDPCTNHCSGVGTATGTIAANNCACNCQHGYRGSECEDAIECSADTGHTCNGHGIHRGTVANDGNDCGCDCHHGWSGNQCTNEIPCTDTCSNHGTATGTIARGNCGCACDGGYTGADCERERPCNDNCNYRGTCWGTVLHWGCNCQSGYSGSHCQNEIPCSNTCYGHGSRTGSVAQNNCGCSCNHGYTGTNCESEVSCPNTCNSHGWTTGKVATGNCGCGCWSGYMGTNCEYDYPCSNHMSCSGHGSATGNVAASTCRCNCNHGYTGGNCEHAPVAVCTNTCSNRGSVTGSPAHGNCGCNCNRGYTGSNCESELSCLPKLENCHGHGTAVGSVAQNSCECRCNLGWRRGVLCEEQERNDNGHPERLF